ncbi:MAG: GC-type dockerin domain-anchored protein, partial [bacterium]
CNTQWDSICANAAITSCPSCENPSNGSCYQAHPTPYCNQPTCCTTVCAADPFCCNTQWDSLCVNRAITDCPSCDNPGNGDCLVVHPTPYCNTPECCSTVCAADPFCCNNQWDSLCASAAISTCASCAPKCPADLDGNGTVGASDLAGLLNAWGTANAAADLDGNGVVGAPDLAALLNAWGPCS